MATREFVSLPPFFMGDFSARRFIFFSSPSSYIFFLISFIYLLRLLCFFFVLIYLLSVSVSVDMKKIYIKY